ncbi:MAG: aspartate aminotransferase family protein [Promethearchaeota archaeon]
MKNLIDIEKKFGSGLYSLKDKVFVRGEGVYLYTDSDEKYLDFMSGHGVACLGHAHPTLIKALEEQSKKIITLHSSYPNETRAKFFELMAEITFKNETKCFMVNSGAEAVEGALKLSLAYNRDKKNPNVIAMKRSFHGRTMGALSLTFNPKYKIPFSTFLSKNVKFASYNNLESIKSLIDDNTACIITEPVQGEGGVFPADKEFLKGLREICDEKDILLIFDEVQTGMGRCGKMFAYEHYDVKPDIISIAKGLGGGFPIGAVVSKDYIWSKIKKGEHASTFGGNPLAAAMAVATIKTLKKDSIPQNSNLLGKYILEKLNKLEFPQVREIRGLGLLIGIQFRTKSFPYIKYCETNEKVLFLSAGISVLRILPPLIIGKKHADKAIEAIQNAISNIS